MDFFAAWEWPIETIICLAAVAAYVVASFCYGVFTRYLRPDGKTLPFRGPLWVWLMMITRCPSCVFACSIIVPLVATFLCLFKINFDLAGRIDLAASQYLEADYPYKWNGAAMQNAELEFAAQGTSPTRLRRLQTKVYISYLDFFYRSKDGGNIFTPEALAEIRRFEQSIRDFKGFADVCDGAQTDNNYQNDDIKSCAPFDTVLNLFYRSENRTGTSEVVVKYDGAGQNLADIREVLLGLAKSGVFWWTDKSFSPTNLASVYTRSRVATQSLKPLSKTATENNWLIQLFKGTLITANDDNKFQHIVISWYNSDLNSFETLYTLEHDILWAFGSFAFVFGFLVFQLRSLFLAVVGLIMILLSFMWTMYIFFNVAQYEKVTVLNLISLFLVTGIAADDMLVFSAQYSISASVKSLKERMVDGCLRVVEPTPRERMAWTYYRAAISSLATSFTTLVSFWSLCFSSLLAVRSFGFFMGTVVALNWIMVTTTYPAAVLLLDLVSERCRAICCRCCPAPCGRLCCRKDVVPIGGDVGAKSSPDTQGQSSADADAARQQYQRTRRGSRCCSRCCHGKQRGSGSFHGHDGYDAQNLDCMTRFFRNHFARCVYFSRYFWVVLTLAISIIGAAFAYVDAKAESGLPQVYLSTLNLGRLQYLMTEVFSSYELSQLNNAISAFPPTAVIQQKACPVGGPNAAKCSGTGTCDPSTYVCVCNEGYIGPECFLQKVLAAKVYADPSLDVIAVVKKDQFNVSAVFQKTLMVYNDADVEVGWSMSSPAAWLTVAPPSGRIGARTVGYGGSTTPGSVSVSVQVDLRGQTDGYSISTSLYVKGFVSITDPGTTQAVSVSGRVIFVPEATSIEVPGTTLIPSFTPTLRSYRIEVPYEMPDPLMNVRYQLPTEGVAIDGVTYASGSPARVLNLTVGVSRLVKVDAMVPSVGVNGTYEIVFQRRPSQPPSSPQLQRVVAGDGTIEVLVAPPERTGGDVISSYEVFATPQGRRLNALPRRLERVPCTAADCWTFDAGFEPGGKCCQFSIRVGNDLRYAVAVIAYSQSGSASIPSVPPLSDSSLSGWTLVKPQQVLQPPRITRPPLVVAHHGWVEITIEPSSVDAAGAVPFGNFVCTSDPDGLQGVGAPGGMPIAVRGLDPALTYAFSCTCSNSRSPTTAVSNTSSPSAPTPIVRPYTPPPPAPTITAIVPSGTSTLQITATLTDAAAISMTCSMNPAADAPTLRVSRSYKPAAPTHSVSLDIEGWRSAIAYNLSCFATNSDVGRAPAPIAVDGSASSDITVKPKPVPPQFNAVPSPSDGKLIVSFLPVSDVYGDPSRVFCDVVHIVDGAAIAQRFDLAYAQTVGLGGLTNGISYRVACFVQRTIPEVNTGVFESVFGESSGFVLVGTAPPSPQQPLSVVFEDMSKTVNVTIRRVETVPAVLRYSCLNVEDPTRNGSISASSAPTFTVSIPTPQFVPGTTYACFASNTIGASNLGPSSVVSAQPTESPTSMPTSAPTNAPTSPTFAPTFSPTMAPTQSPTLAPTMEPTFIPTMAPTFVPTMAPTNPPVIEPTPVPTLAPTAAPTRAPTSSPTVVPTMAPTFSPSMDPTQSPTPSPTMTPTLSPTGAPTQSPTLSPTSTKSPTTAPSGAPSLALAPSVSPTSASPSVSPTSASPSVSPTSASPSVSPTTASPSVSPTSASPSESPTSALPTTSPTLGLTRAPTKSPQDSPSETPTEGTALPSVSPTSKTDTPTSSPSISFPEPPTIRRVVQSDRAVTIEMNTISSGGSPVLSTICYSQDRSVGGTSASLTLVLTNLVAGISYSFHCAARNVIGTSAYGPYSDPVVVVSLPSAPTVIANITGAQELTVSMVMRTAADNGFLDLVEVFGEANDASLNFDSVAQVGAAVQTKFVFQNLVAGRSYQFRTKVANALGFSPFSAFTPFVIAVMAPLPPVVTCLQPSDSSITATIQAPSLSSDYDPVIAFRCFIMDGANLVATQSISLTDLGVTANYLVVLGGLQNGIARRVRCEAISQSGLFVVPSELFQELTPGVAVVSRLLIADSTVASLSNDELRQAVADALNVPVASVVVGLLAAEDQDPKFSGCVTPSGGGSNLGTRRLASFLQMQVKVLVRSESDPSILGIMSSMNALPLPSGTFARTVGGSVTVLDQPTVKNAAYADSTLASLAVIPKDVSLWRRPPCDPCDTLVPSFDPSIVFYQVNVSSGQYSISAAMKSQGLAYPLEVETDASPGYVPLQNQVFSVQNVAPISQLLRIKGTAGDGSSTTIYSIRVFFQSLESSCFANCGGNASGRCDGLRGKCICKPDYQGDICNISCPKACSGHGSCSSSGCVCDQTYNDTSCAERVCPQCANVSTCKVGDQTLDSIWSCQCPPDRKGALCDEPRCPNDCSGQGDCDKSTAKCTCYPSYQPPDCAVKIVLEPITKCADVSLAFGISGYDPIKKGKPIYDFAFHFEEAFVQQYILDLVKRARTTLGLRVRSETTTFIEFLVLVGEDYKLGFPIVGAELALVLNVFTNASFAGEQAIKTFKKDIGIAKSASDVPVVRYVRVTFRINVLKTAQQDKLKPLAAAWTSFVEEENAKAPDHLKALWYSDVFSRMYVEQSIINSTITSFLLSMVLNFVSVIVFVGDVQVAFFVILHTLTVCMTLAGAIISVLKWKIGAVQVVAFTTFVGLSVDYALHIGHAFTESHLTTRKAKMVEGLMHMGASVMGGAVTTAGANCFLLPCWIYLFYQLGLMLILNAVVAMLYALLFLPALLMICGPLSDRCDIYACIQCKPCRKRRELRLRAGHGSQWSIAQLGEGGVPPDLIELPAVTAAEVVEPDHSHPVSLPIGRASDEGMKSPGSRDDSARNLQLAAEAVSEGPDDSEMPDKSKPSRSPGSEEGTAKVVPEVLELPSLAAVLSRQAAVIPEPKDFDLDDAVDDLGGPLREETSHPSCVKFQHDPESPVHIEVTQETFTSPDIKGDSGSYLSKLRQSQDSGGILSSQDRELQVLASFPSSPITDRE